MKGSTLVGEKSISVKSNIAPYDSLGDSLY